MRCRENAIFTYEPPARSLRTLRFRVLSRVWGFSILYGRTQMRGNPIHVQHGDRYGHLVIIEEAAPRISKPRGDRVRRMKCQCDCGNEIIVDLQKLRLRHPACGCRRRGVVQHGWSGHPLYKVWCGMIARCEDPTDPSYRRYGGRGITVCREWHNRDSFLAWASANGWQKGLQIDRRDNSRGYYPDNCRFVTATTNQRNTRRNRLITFNGETRLMIEWAEHLGISYQTISSRINTRGWSIDRAFTEPVKQLTQRAKT